MLHSALPHPALCYLCCAHHHRCWQQEVEEVLQESEQERKEIRDKYIALGEKVEVLLHQERHNKSSADRDTEAAKLAVKEAVADLEAVSIPLPV